MKLATVTGQAGPRVCAVVQNDSAVIDLQAVHLTLKSRASDSFRSMMDLIENGEPALDAARELVEKASHHIEPDPLSAVTLMAPVPVPSQMRDALCFELHCLQAFRKARELRASLSPDPEEAMRDMETRGVLSVPTEFYQLPLYYKQNRFSVSAPESEVVWPAYSKVMTTS